MSGLVPGLIPDPTLLRMPWWFDDTALNLLQTILAAGSLLVAVLLGLGAVWLAKRQMDIAHRQMDMQTEQHVFFSEQLAKRPKVQLIVVGMLERIHEIQKDRRQVLLTIAARNFGTRVADGFFWEIRFPEKLSNVLGFADALWKPTGYGAVVENDILYSIQKDFYDKKLFVNTHTDVARILVQANRIQDLVVEWRVEGENGPEPEKGYGEIRIGPRDELLAVWPVLQ